MKIEDCLPKRWTDFFSIEKRKPYFHPLMEEIEKRYEMTIVFPKKENIFKALELINPEDVKVVIIGQDPYHEANQANGLAFSVSEGVSIPRSLTNIFKELNYEFGYSIPKKNGDLSKWARQGVMLLNASLTVEEGKANSHSKLGWTIFTDDLISYLDKTQDGLIYILWGNYAYQKKELIHNENSKIIHCAHPSPLSASRGFFYSDCFKKCNQLLKEKGKKEIDWQIVDK